MRGKRKKLQLYMLFGWLKKNVAFSGMCFLLFFVTACESKLPSTVSETYSGMKLYRFNSTLTKVVGEAYALRATEMEKQVEEFLAELVKKPSSEEYVACIPETVEISGFSVSKGGVLTVQFENSYTQVTGVEEVLMRAAIVKTLCQVEGIEAVEFYVGGQPLMRANGKPVGMMMAEDFIDNTGAETEYYQDVYLTFYFSDQTGTSLLESDLKITYDGTISTEQLVLRQLIAGPIEETMKQTLPEGTSVNKVSVKDGVCNVDFNDKFMEKSSDVTEQVVIYSIVNSLVELPNIYKVQFTINGETKKNYYSIDISNALERNLDLIVGEQ